MAMSTTEQRDDVNAKVDRVLKEAGLDASPMDPSSMEALKEFMLEMPKENDPAFAAVVNRETRKAPPLSRVTQNTLQRRVSDLTQGADTFAYNNNIRDFDSNASTAGSTGAGASPMEQKILDQLHQQTELIWQLHRRIETLTTTVEKLATNGGGGNVAGSTARETKANANGTQATPRVRRREVLLPRVVPDVVLPDNADPDQQAVPPLPENLPVRVGMINRAYQSLAAIPTAVRNSRMAKIVKVYVALRQREAPNFDLLLIFKVLVMVTIFMTRMSSNRKNTESFMWMYRTYLIGSFIVVGFLFKTGYIKFMHAFIVKENYPGRIWDGEDIDIDNLPPMGIVRRPGPVAAAQDAAGPAGPLAFLQRTLLAGRIPRMDPARRGAVVLNAIQDLFCLVGSFFLSIFPMWAPEAPQAAQPRGPVAPPAHFQQRLAELQQQQQELEQQQQQQIPGVQPPADAFEAEADDNAD
jgi:hypothetical protein